jgi:histidinol-phosphate/aromatic aminotransferase/cobyric acid decarboxylase-like protein
MGGYGLGEWLRISVGSMPENRRCAATLARALGRKWTDE